ncbi:MAG TPA: DUF72 domain-containing protein [Chitinivibrionales bacterium]|nr:DUF72 domain-containing protein [Chitinivibrionales bacterium]
MKIFVGTSGYGYKEWKGNFYPEKISADKMLSFYSGRLETVEVNNTFYRMPTEPVVMGWAKQVPPGFMFAIKAPQMITHIKRLKNVKEETRFFLKSVSRLGKKLGCVLFQFPASFRQDAETLGNFLGLIPEKIPCAFDFRSSSWMDMKIFGLLRDKGCCLCMEDTDEKSVEEIVGTTSWGYLRLRRPDYSEGDLSGWAKKISLQKWKTAFVFFKHEDDSAARGPALALRFRELTGSK